MTCQICTALRNKIKMNKERLVAFKKKVGEAINEPAYQKKLRALAENVDDAQNELKAHLQQQHTL